MFVSRRIAEELMAQHDVISSSLRFVVERGNEFQLDSLPRSGRWAISFNLFAAPGGGNFSELLSFETDFGDCAGQSSWPLDSLSPQPLDPMSFVTGTTLQ